MGEREWLACADPGPMLEFLRTGGNARERKLRLFACACCRRIWDLHTKRERKAIKAAEGGADGLRGPEELRRQNRQVERGARGRSGRWRFRDQRVQMGAKAAFWAAAPD